MLTRDEILSGWAAFMDDVPDSATLAAHMALADRAALVERLARSDTFVRRCAAKETNLLQAVKRFEDDRAAPFEVARYVVPESLTVSPSPIASVLMVGACVLDGWSPVIAAAQPGIVADQTLIFHGGPLQSRLDRPIASYDCAILQVPLRLVLLDYDLFRPDFTDVAEYEAMLDRCVQRLDTMLVSELDQLDGLPVFVANYPLPQLNPLGRLLPRYDLRNPVFFIDALNRALAARIAERRDVHLLDLDQIAATFGRRFVQDDAFAISNHGGLINDYNTHADGERLEPSEPLTHLYPTDTRGFIAAAWAEVTAMMRTLRGTDTVKMICVDIDDTLWRGVAAELDAPDPIIVEGWPIGFAEALAMLKRRGIILALVSKNDPARVAEIWPKIFHTRLQMTDFAIHKIGWRPKAETIAEAIAEANVLPEAVVFIDDNPVERAAVAAALPGVRMLGAPHLDWRRTLLWAPETQVAAVSTESTRRTEMIRAQGERETTRGTMNRAAFLASLDLTAELHIIESTDAATFPRAFELLNKTNQFNTSGQRWTHAKAARHFAHGESWWAFTVADRFTAYGLVGVLVMRGQVVVQFVMSCRVFGLGVEQAVLAVLADRTARSGQRMVGNLQETERNGPCRSVYYDAGWTPRDSGRWIARPKSVSPSHVTVSVVDGAR